MRQQRFTEVVSMTTDGAPQPPWSLTIALH